MTMLPMTAKTSLYLQMSETEGRPASGNPGIVPRNSIQPAVCNYAGNVYNTGAQVCMNVLGQGIWAVCGNRGTWTLTGAQCALAPAAGAGGAAAAAA